MNRTESPQPESDQSSGRSINGPVRVAWREGTLTRITELEALCAWLSTCRPVENHQALIDATRRHLDAAAEAAQAAKLNPPKYWRRPRSGALIERAMSNLDAAEADLLNLAPADYVLGQMPCLLRHVQCHLTALDPRRQEFERIAERVGILDVDNPLLHNSRDLLPTKNDQLKTVEEERPKIIGIVRGASSAALREQVRLRSFRNVVVVTSILMAVLAIGIAITGFIRPTLIPMCFAPEAAGEAVVVCPTGQSPPFVPAGGQSQDGIQTEDIDDVVKATAQGADLMVVELVGLTAAAIATATAIRRIKGSSERYGLPVALAALKLPTGAITAFLGLLLMRGQFIPGLSALDTSAQILAWALVFGYAQQLFTRLVDQQGQTVLDNVRGGTDKLQISPSPAA